ncbi:peptidylprolyl isomerase [Candidatus Haliotispira prima]|uniref:Peptidylprolyl isomerase n=1 Tax=Candidatus Haliotispira prima TaxID=3034016 RepID=A0ABY8MEL0_9SPIO|nr:peptidylprolyl isomerase [Candidatus Haliotispira prima]
MVDRVKNRAIFGVGRIPVAALLFASLQFFGVTGSLFAQKDTDTLATIRLTKTEVILGKEYNDVVRRLAELRQGSLSGADRKEVLESLINNHLVLQAAERDNISVGNEEVSSFALQMVSQQAGKQLSEAEMRKLLEEEGVSYQDFLNNARNSIIIRRFVQKKYGTDLQNVADPNDKEVIDAYNENLEQFVHKDMIRFNQILVQFKSVEKESQKAVKNKAEDLLKRVKNNGEKIADLAPLYSDDPQSKARGGDVSYVPRGLEQLEQVFGKKFFDVLFGLSKGDIRILESNVGYHVVEITDYRAAGLYKLNSEIPGTNGVTVKDYVRNMLVQQVQAKRLEELVSDYMEQLRKEATIKILYKSLQK